MVGLLLAAWLLVNPASAVEVAFLEFRSHDGQKVQLEPDGTFGHVAIRVGRQWLHAYPPRVTLADSLDYIDHTVEVVRIVHLEHAFLAEPPAAAVAYWLGKPFDFTFSWTHPQATYCSRLVADLLGIAPQPTQFAAKHWVHSSVRPIGQLGLSPDDLYSILRQRGFKIKLPTCDKRLTTRISRGRPAPVYR